MNILVDKWKKLSIPGQQHKVTKKITTVEDKHAKKKGLLVEQTDL